ncbi:hypothetical protein AN958_11980 [Leucoagaricus sp. SymC.cos]|nr:hypothetical protein AN958_11980 [Leucoagaricus sp. SymC.cos]
MSSSASSVHLFTAAVQAPPEVLPMRFKLIAPWIEYNALVIAMFANRFHRNGNLDCWWRLRTYSF